MAKTGNTGSEQYEHINKAKKYTAAKQRAGKNVRGGSK